MIQPFRGTQINRTHPLVKGLIGAWPFNDGTGLKTWDYSGNANKGTLEGGATWAPGRRGWAVNCDGVDGRIDCGNAAPLDQIGNGDFSVVFRMKSKDAVPLNSGALLNKHENANNTLWLYANETPRLVLLFSKTGISGFSIFAANPFDALRHHIVITINRTIDKAFAYIDSIKDSVETDLSSLPADSSNTGRLSWGARDSGVASYEGLLSDLLLYNLALTQEKINWLYREPYAMFDVSEKSRFFIILVPGKLNVAFTEKRPSIAFS